MTATVEETSTQSQGGAVGRIARVIGPVVDIEFPTDAMPPIYNALTCEFELSGETKSIILEVAQHIGDGLVRGGQVTDTGASITVPVGDATLGKVFNTTGDVLNLEEGESFEPAERWG